MAFMAVVIMLRERLPPRHSVFRSGRNLIIIP